MRAEVKEGRRHVAESLVNHMKNYGRSLEQDEKPWRDPAEDHLI